MSEQRKVRTDFNCTTGKTIVTNHKASISDETWDAIFGKKDKKQESVDKEENKLD